VKLVAIKIESQSFPIVWSIVGSALFMAILGPLQASRDHPAYQRETQA